MIGCDYCDEWFHPDCLKLSKNEVKILTKSQWACPICEPDDNEGILRDVRRVPHSGFTSF